MFAPQPIANEGNTPEPAVQENLRRQQIMRFGLIICLLFLILDNGSQVSNPTPSGPRTNSWHTEIPLGDQYGVKIQSILSHQSQNIQNIVQKPINSTGLFRGPWNVVSKQNNVTQEYSTTDGSVLVQLVSVPVRNLPDLTFVYGLLHLYKNPELEGRAHQQVKQDVGFPVQGVVVSSQRKMVVFSTPYRSQRLYVRLASKHHFGNFTGLKPSHGRSGRRRLLADALDASLTGHDGHKVVEIEPGESGHSEGDALVFGSHTAPELFDFHPHSSANPISSSQVQQYSLSVVRTLLSAVGGERARSGAERNQGSSGHRALSGDVSSGVGSDANGGALSMRVLGLGDARQTSSGNNNEVLLTELTDAGFLSVMLADQPLTVPKAASPGASNQTQQQQQPKSGEGVNETAPPASPTRVAAAVGKNKTEGEFLVSIALGETVLPGKFKALQSTALPPSLRQHLVGGAPVQWGNATQTTVPVAGVPAQQECQYLGQLDVETRSSRAERSGAAGGSSDLSQAVDFAEQGEGEGGAVETVGSVMMGASAPPERDAPPPATAAATAVANASSSSSSKTSPAPVPVKLEPALALTGTLSSGDCGKTITFEATAFHIEFNALKVKVELYALVASMLSLVQVFLVIYQINYCSTQAQASKVSLVSLFGQSLLDANLCMAHLLLSFAFPTVFFASFIWICVLKMLLFSVLQMRFIINTYQARYAQELAAEGFNGIRRRLIGLHAGFYGVLLVVLLVSIAFYKRPVVAVFAMYSFWLPQVVYSAYMGTKHSFHPLYLVGVSLCHLFIPLYILGCPNNFLGLLSVYTNPHYLAEIAGEHGAHAQDLHHLSLSSVSACWVLVVWMTFQVGVLLLQTALGPRFFVPKKWLPSRYDYKRPVPDTLRAAFPASNGSGSGHSTPRGSGSGRNESLGDIAMTGIRSRSSASSSSSTRASSTSGYGGLQALFGYGRSSSGAAGSDSEEDMETGRLLGDGGGSSGGGVAGSGSNASPSATSGESNPGGMDCAICCNLIHFNSRDNLITPCDHVFHEECLERWTHVKLECPVCRSALPSLGED